MKRILALLFLLSAITTAQTQLKVRTIYEDTTRVLSTNYGTLDTVHNKSRERFYRPGRFDSTMQFMLKLMGPNGALFTFPNVGGTFATTTIGGSVGNADSLGGYAAASWFYLPDTNRHYYTKFAAKLNHADTTNDWAPRGTYIFPSDTVLSRNYTTALLSYKLNSISNSKIQGCGNIGEF